MLRIGILGVAHLHADAYIGNLRASGVEVVGVHDRDVVRARAWGARFGVPVDEDLAPERGQGDVDGGGADVDGGDQTCRTRDT